MFITGIVITILGFLSAVYSSLASFSPLRHVLLFRWFFISRFYRNALKGVSILEKMNQTPSKDAIIGTLEFTGVLIESDNGFNELKIVLKQEKIIETSIDKIELIKASTPSWDNENNQPLEKTKLTLVFSQNGNSVKTWAIESVQSINDIVEKSIQFRFAILNIFLAFIVCAIGVVLIILSR